MLSRMESRAPYQTNSHAPTPQPIDLSPIVAWLNANAAPFVADPHRKVQVTLHFAGGKFGGGDVQLRDVRAGEDVLAGIAS